MLPLRTALAVAAGAMVGAGVRYLIDELIPWNGSSWPWATFAVNVAGCLAIAVAASRMRRDTERWALIVPGALGGLTTMSTFLAETRILWVGDRQVLAGGYLAVTLAVTLGTVAMIRITARARTA